MAFTSTKPFLKSKGCVGGVGGATGNLLGLLATLGIFVPSPIVQALAFGAALTSSIFGILGRTNAQTRIKGIIGDGECSDDGESGEDDYEVQ